jgi:hypothetical protein
MHSTLLYAISHRFRHKNMPFSSQLPPFALARICYVRALSKALFGTITAAYTQMNGEQTDRWDNRHINFYDLTGLL